MPGDEQQRVVDADAEPDHGGDRRGGAADVGDRASRAMTAVATPSPAIATISGSPAATTEPSANTRISRADDDADRLGGAGRRGDVLGDLTAELDLQARTHQRLGRGPQGVHAGGALEVGDRDRVPHRDQRRVAVGRHARRTRRRRRAARHRATTSAPTIRRSRSGPSECTTTRALALPISGKLSRSRSVPTWACRPRTS